MDFQTFTTKADAQAFRAFARDHKNVTKTDMIVIADGFLVIVYTK